MNFKAAWSVLTGSDRRSASNLVPVGGLTSPDLLDMLNLNSGSVHVSPESALRLATVFRCIDLLSSTAAAMPWELMQKFTDGRRESAIKHPNYSLYKTRPSKLMTSFIWRKTLFVHALGWGNGYAKIIRNGVYRPTEFKIYHPTKVNVMEYQDEIWYSFDGGEPVPSGDVIHLKLFTTDGIVGRSPIRQAVDSLKIPLQGQRYANAFLDNGARVAGVLTSPNKMTDSAKGVLGRAWQAFVGSGAFGTPVLDEGVKYEAIGIPPGDFKLLELIQASDKQICTWFGMPQHLAGILDHATFSNIEHQDLEYVKYSLLPHLINLEQEVDYKTLRTAELGEFYTRINVNGLLRADFKTRYEGYRTAIQNGLMCQDEARALEDQNPIPDGSGKRYWIQQNMMPLDKADEILAGKSGGSTPPTNEEAQRAINGHKLNGHSVTTDN